MVSRLWIGVTLAAGCGARVNGASLLSKQKTLAKQVPCDGQAADCEDSRSDFPDAVVKQASERADEQPADRASDKKDVEIVDSQEQTSPAKETEIHTAAEKVETSPKGCTCKSSDPDCDCILDGKKSKGSKSAKKSVLLSETVTPNSEAAEEEVSSEQDTQDESGDSEESDPGGDCECIDGRSADPDCDCPPVSHDSEVQSCRCDKDDPDCDCILDSKTQSAHSTDEDESASNHESSEGASESSEASDSESKLSTQDSLVNFHQVGKQQPQVLNSGPPPTVSPPPSGPVAPAPPVGSVPVAQPVIDPLQLKYDELKARIEKLRAEIKLWSDHPTWNQKIAADKLAVEKETTPALADMLADTRYEMHQLVVPVFVEVLTDKLEILLEQERDLKAQLDAKKGGATAPGEKWEKKTNDSAAGPNKISKRIDVPTMVILFLAGVVIVAGVYMLSSQRSSTR